MGHLDIGGNGILFENHLFCVIQTKVPIETYEWCGIVEEKYLSKPAILAALLLQNKLRLGRAY